MTDLPSVADGQTRQLDPRVITVDRLSGVIHAAVIAVVLVVALLVVVVSSRVPDAAKPIAALAWVGAAFAIGYWTYQWPAVAYRHASYRVGAGGIEIRRGVVWRRTITVPRSRVQHTDVAQGPLERRYGLGTLLIHTAGTDHARVELRGLDHAVASRIRDHLLPGEGGDAV